MIHNLNETLLRDESQRQKLAETSLKNIFNRLSRVKGEAFFKTLVQQLAQALDVRYVLAARVERGSEQEVSHTIAVWAGDDFMDNVAYRLNGTPCQNVANQEMCFHPKDVQDSYPDDVLLREMEAESYIGMPMVDTEGVTLGILVALDDKPMSEGKRYLALSLLSIFATRGAAELQFQDREEALRQLVLERTRELEETQSFMVQQEKLVSLGRLVEGVAQEVNTPIGIAETGAVAMQSFARKAKELVAADNLNRAQLVDVVGKLNESARQVTDNLHRASMLVRSFRNLAVDQMSDKLVTLELQSYLEELLAAHLPAMRGKSIYFNVNVKDDLEVFLPADALSQIVSNLVMNTAIHGLRGRKSGKIRLQAYAQGEEFVLRYEDDGCGIDEEAKSQLFEPFYTTNRSGGSTGLGLHLVFNIVSRLGGSVDTYLPNNGGLGFCFSLPRRYEVDEWHHV